MPARFGVEVFNQWSGVLDGFFTPVVSKLIQHQFQPGLLYRLYRCIGRQGHCIGGLFPADEPVGKDQDFSVFEDVHAVVHAAPATGGQPHVLGDESGSNDGGFLGLNQGYDSFRVAGEEVLAKEALGHGPAAG